MSYVFDHSIYLGWFFYINFNILMLRKTEVMYYICIVNKA